MIKLMCHRTVESMMIKDSILCNAEYHNRRLKYTCNVLFGGIAESKIPCVEYLIEIDNFPEMFRTGIVKCRLLYDVCDGQFNSRLEYAHYEKRCIMSLKLVAGSPEYSFKYTDRTALNKLMEYRAGCDDVIIVKNGLLTDASSANIVLLKDDRWFTPSEPLLKGTARARLLDEGIISEAVVSPKELVDFEGLRLINAMLPFNEQPIIPVSSIKGL